MSEQERQSQGRAPQERAHQMKAEAQPPQAVAERASFPARPETAVRPVLAAAQEAAPEPHPPPPT